MVSTCLFSSPLCHLYERFSWAWLKNRVLYSLSYSKLDLQWLCHQTALFCRCREEKSHLVDQKWADMIRPFASLQPRSAAKALN
jgi:hypothetical protein